MWKTEDCAEAAELLSGLVAAVIILMLVVKLLWKGKKPLWLILCPPQPLDAELQCSTGWLLHNHHHHM